MAERRMIAKTIIDSDLFLDMPMSTQCLYFHLNMRADDDGFINNPKKIQRMVGCSDDDIKLLIVKNFIIPFESGVVVIKHWRIHNYIRSDRKKDTIFKNEAKMLELDENGAYELMPDNNENIEEIKNLPSTDARKIAYEKSSLPYSFEYKIKKEFIGKECPMCGCTMNYANNLVKPSIQHNIPLSRGGEHELGNISVICLSCNSSVKNTETGPLNSEEVIEIWDKINQKNNDNQMTVICQSSDNQMTYPGKVRLGKVSKDIEKKEKITTIDKLIKEYTNNNDLIETLKDFVKMRKAIKKPLTDRALKGILNKLDKLSENEDIKIKILEQSIENCWAGVFELKNIKTSTNSINQNKNNIPKQYKTGAGANVNNSFKDFNSPEELEKYLREMQKGKGM